MKKQILFLIGLSVLLIACGTSKNAEQISTPPPVDSSEQTINGSEHQIIFEDIADGDSLFASINKTWCYGTCPVYRMRIYNSGYTEFDGQANVEMIGLHTTFLRKEDMIKFIDKANEIKFMEMEDEYDNPGITDLPSTTTSIVMASTRKTVRRRVGYPQELRGYEQLFIDLIEGKSWVKERGS
ncbi:MAG: DUF6438 domain-containing protein [Crocinitomicaceae bacterium]|nr:DUF6438 domain-containing protein [Crocinitomicaceae bacterium]